MKKSCIQDKLKSTSVRHRWAAHVPFKTNRR